MNIVSRIALFITIIVLAGCASVNSSVGLYGDTPANVKESDEKAMISFDVVGHDMDDIRYATKTAAGIDGLIVDVERDNMISGYGLSSGPKAHRCNAAKGYTFAVYFKALSKNKTKVTVVVDAMGFCFGEIDNVQYVAQKFMANTNKILLTYE